MYSVHPSVLFCISTSQSGSLKFVLSCMPFFFSACKPADVTIAPGLVKAC